MFIKYKDFTVAQKQTSLDQPTDVTAVILNEARRMLGEIWDRQYDEEKAKAEDARMLAYERKTTDFTPVAVAATPSFPAPTGNPTPPPTTAPPERFARRNSGASSVTPKAPKDDALVFTYENGEKALSAAKKAIKGHPDYRFHRTRLPDGTDCFEVVSGTKVLERHCVTNKNHYIYTFCQCLAGRETILRETITKKKWKHQQLFEE